jgi:hypothetical protein
MAMKITKCRQQPAESAPCEPNLHDVLSDPVVNAVMRADGVSRDELAGILRLAIRRRLFGPSGQPTETGAPEREAQAGSSGIGDTAQKPPAPRRFRRIDVT